jgi:hypothetical protein
VKQNTHPFIRRIRFVLRLISSEQIVSALVSLDRNMEHRQPAIPVLIDAAYSAACTCCLRLLKESIVQTRGVHSSGGDLACQEVGLPHNALTLQHSPYSQRNLREYRVKLQSEIKLITRIV